MSEQALYLQTDLIVEPLINQWYAWPLLVSPHSAALITANHHMRMLESFVQHPEHHRRMAATMKGGSFVDLDAAFVPQVRQWLQRARQSAEQLELAKAIEQLSQLCASFEKGASLEKLYAEVPAPLRGCVELGYDAYGHLSPRFFEQALYRGPAYSSARQSLLLHRHPVDDRPFIFSTPRFSDGSSIELRLPFSAELLDRLFRMRSEAGDPAIVDELLDLAGGSRVAADLIRGWFTPCAPVRRPPRCRPGEIKVRYLNHASLLFSSDKLNVLVDPIVPNGGAGRDDRWSFADLPERIDYVVLTHAHQDHVVLETLLQIRHRIGTIVTPGGHRGFLQDPSLRLALQHLGFEHVIDLDVFESVETCGGRITGLPFLGEHGDLHIASKLTYLIEIEGQRFFVGADANNLQPECFDSVRRWFGSIDTVFIGMECKGAPMSWLYGPLMQTKLTRAQDEARRLNGSNCERAAALIDSLGPKRAYVYAMGAEPWLSFISSIEYGSQSLPIVESDKLVQRCLERGIESRRLFGIAEMSFV
jgi:L-ascorbate metabolism protein UlaG (beta-lactamase superfamily)